MWSDASRSRGVDIEMLRRYRARQCNRPDWCWRSPGGHAAEDRITQECPRWCSGFRRGGGVPGKPDCRCVAIRRAPRAHCGAAGASEVACGQSRAGGSGVPPAPFRRPYPLLRRRRTSIGSSAAPGISSTPQPAPVASETLRVSRSYDDRLRTVTKAQGTIAAVRDAASIIMLIARLP
jgi:hypothetical protein